MKGELSTFSALTSSGKSGSFFYYSYDGRFVLKTIRREEFKFLRRILQNYHDHVMQNKKTLIPKFFGLHKIVFTNSETKKDIGSNRVYFCIMDNLFGIPIEMDEIYDLKGSTYKREISAELRKEVITKKTKIAMKDNDFLKIRKKLSMKKEELADLLDVLEADCAFFESNQIIDYSLLVGIHQKNEMVLNFELD